MRTIPADFVCFLLLLLSAAAVSHTDICFRLHPVPRQAGFIRPGGWNPFHGGSPGDEADVL